LTWCASHATFSADSQVPNGVMVALLSLTQYVKVRVLVRQPLESPSPPLPSSLPDRLACTDTQLSSCDGSTTWEGYAAPLQRTLLQSSYWSERQCESGPLPPVRNCIYFLSPRPLCHPEQPVVIPSNPLSSRATLCHPEQPFVIPSYPLSSRACRGISVCDQE
jgi:hypothetical protein